jgi:hypothetical protein
MRELNGRELTCKDILKVLDKSVTATLDNRILFRLILERLEFLEEYVNDIKEANNLYNKGERELV